MPNAKTKKAESVDEAVEVARPLSATASRALQKLIDNDFENVKSEIVQYANDVEEQRLKEVREEWVEKTQAAETFSTRAQELVDTFIRESEALQRIARLASVNVEIPNFRYGYGSSKPSVEAQVVGLDVAEGEVRRVVARERTKAINALERHRLTAQRKVLLATVTAEAEQVLGQIPSARDLFEGTARLEVQA